MIIRVASSEDSLVMRDALVAVMGGDGFRELKRTRIGCPDPGL